MIEITEENYRDIKFNEGIIVCVNKNTEQYRHQGTFNLVVESDYTTNKKHENPNASVSSFTILVYDSLFNYKGFYLSGREGCFAWNKEDLKFQYIRYFLFKDFEELCIWYLQQHKYLIEHNDGENIGYVPKIIPVNTENNDKTRVYEKCGTNTCPPSCPKCLSMENTNKKKKIKRKDKYKDILKLLEIRDRIKGEVELAHLHSQLPFKHDNRMFEYANELNAFLEQEVDAE